jgi:hypothetical protein
MMNGLFAITIKYNDYVGKRFFMKVSLKIFYIYFPFIHLTVRSERGSYDVQHHVLLITEVHKTEQSPSEKFSISEIFNNDKREASVSRIQNHWHEKNSSCHKILQKCTITVD